MAGVVEFKETNVNGRIRLEGIPIKFVGLKEEVSKILPENWKKYVGQ